ncbi:hypothetical protein [Exiguobacterium sp. B203-G5 25_7]|uniref:hypothetical protein n=1 Tax=Exiguobacterium sp. R-39 TaxID=3416708 RepID=UPI001049B934
MKFFSGSDFLVFIKRQFSEERYRVDPTYLTANSAKISVFRREFSEERIMDIEYLLFLPTLEKRIFIRGIRHPSNYQFFLESFEPLDELIGSIHHLIE